jgi:hypothetical protein
MGLILKRTYLKLVVSPESEILDSRISSASPYFPCKYKQLAMFDTYNAQAHS